MGMGVGVAGGIQPLMQQLRGQGAFGNPYVSPAITNSSTGAPNTGEMTGPPNMANSAGGFPDPRGAGSLGGLGSYTSGGSSSLNSMPSAGGSGGSGGPFPLQGQYGIVKMAEGGLTGDAQNMAGMGRGGDSMLVHMSPGEVKGLQALAMAHGGSLSINPNTGLVEANFLKRILPMVAGAALSPFITPMGAAALVGGLETARTGDIGKGLMAGLGAYGGAGLTQGLSTAGAQTGAAGTTTATQAANASANATPIATEVTKDAVGTQAGAALRGFSPIPGANPAVTNTAAEALKAGVQAPVTMGNVSSGFGQLGSEAGRSAVYNALPKYTLPAAGVSLVNAATPEPEVPGMPGEEDYGPYKLKRLSANFQGSTPVQPNPYYRPTGLGYAAGGLAGYAAGGAFDDEGMGDDVGMAAGGVASYSNQGQVRHLPESVGVPRTGIFRDTDPDTARKDALEAAMERNKKLARATNVKLAAMPKTSVKGLGDVQGMAEGGLGGYSDGGRMLKGPGDGMSDSIPATIGRKQPARLADGEFVVPADVVSHLGNGSTDAGAKKLYSMMDKIRKARTGKKKQAPAVKADKYLPV